MEADVPLEGVPLRPGELVAGVFDACSRRLELDESAEDETGMSLLGRMERVVHAEMEFGGDHVAVEGTEPASAPSDERRRLRHLVQPKHRTVEAASVILSTARDRDLDVMEPDRRLRFILTSRYP
ncbi:hypothetical protein KM872_04060 [Brevibacterium luteolum]|nr:hypothetical protein [Brevibacterium luteolum]